MKCYKKWCHKKVLKIINLFSNTNQSPVAQKKVIFWDWIDWLISSHWTQKELVFFFQLSLSLVVLVNETRGVGLAGWTIPVRHEMPSRLRPPPLNFNEIFVFNLLAKHYTFHITHVVVVFVRHIRDGWPYKNGWIFGKNPNGLWTPPPLIFGKSYCGFRDKIATKVRMFLMAGLL